jgi:transposase
MLCLILIVGGLLIVMGQHDRSEALFYYFRLEDHVPETHLLRLIEKHISFAFVREKLKASYSDTGRPSIDPELLLRILLIGYFYGITSERKLVEELRMHLAWRWFTGLGFDQEIPHHSTFSKNRHGRFQESKLFEELFEQIVKQCVEVGLVQGKHLSVDGSFVEANASKESRIPREQLTEAAQVHQTVREYLVNLVQQNPVEEPVHQQDQVSTTDPDSTYATKGGVPARLGYYDHYLVDNHSCVIVGVQATAARMSQETVAAQDMLTRFAHWQGREPESVAADTTYGNGEFLQWLADRNVTAYMRTRDSALRKNNPGYGPERFTYQPESNTYRCPAGEQLNYVGLTFAIERMPTSAARNDAEHAHKKHNARVDDTSISPFTCMSRYDNAHGSWRKRPSSRRHSDKGRRWKRCSQNSRIRSGCAACASADSSLSESSSSSQQRLRTSKN